MANRFLKPTEAGKWEVYRILGVKEASLPTQSETISSPFRPTTALFN
jgi:hypothetical protein